MESCTDNNDCQPTEKQLQVFEPVIVKANDAVLIAEVDPINEPRLQFLDVNQPFTYMTAYSFEELLGKTRILKAAKTNPAVLDQIRIALEAWQTVRAEFIDYRKDGCEFWVELNIAPVADKTGCYTHWISIERDITEGKRIVALQQQTSRERLMGVIAQRIRQSLNLEEILKTTVAEVQQFLQTDRVFIYRFASDWSGVVAVESVASDWPPIIGKLIRDHCFGENYVQPYKQGRIQATADIYTANLSECHIDLLAQCRIRANLVVPIVQGEELWGLLVANQCSGPRQWQQLEIDLLKQLATQVAIAIQQSELYQQLQAANQELQRLASLDSLTQLANRRRFQEYLDQEWRRMAREQAPLSLILCDIDFFKTYNDTYGHQAGDDCLQQVAKAISYAVERPADLVARYGGEEFAVILPNTKAEGAIQVAEKIRSRVQALRIANASSCRLRTLLPGTGTRQPQSLSYLEKARDNYSDQLYQHLTLSLGVASTVPGDESSHTIIIAAADRALYQAKAQGRDCVVLETFEGTVNLTDSVAKNIFGCPSLPSI